MTAMQNLIPSRVVLVKSLNDYKLGLALVRSEEGHNVLISDGEIEYLHGEDEYSADGVYQYTAQDVHSIKGGTYCIDKQFDEKGKVCGVTVYITN